MQEVAEEAGVNRGLIHRYFGNRRALFRAALDRGAEEALPLHERARPNAPMKRAVDQFRGSLEISDWTRLVTLLALDGDDSFDAMPFGESRIADMKREQATGLFSEDVDIPVALLEWDASLLGYSILRKAASRQLGIPLNELDDRMLAVLRRYAEGKPRTSASNGRRSKAK
jgi:AcrR family transcriptional regulator